MAVDGVLADLVVVDHGQAKESPTQCSKAKFGDPNSQPAKTLSKGSNTTRGETRVTPNTTGTWTKWHRHGQARQRENDGRWKARDQAAEQSLAVCLDFVTGIYPKGANLQLTDWGNVLMAGFHVMASALGAAFGAFLRQDNQGTGAAIGSVGGTLVGLMTAGFKDRFVTKQTRDIKSFIRQYPLDMINIQKLATKHVKRVEDRDLNDDKGNVDIVRNKLEGQYVREIRGQLLGPLSTRFRTFRNLFKNRFFTAYGDLTRKKFEDIPQQATVWGKEKAEKDLPGLKERILKKQEQLETTKKSRDEEIRRAEKLPDKEKEEKEKEIRKRYDNDIEEQEGKLKEDEEKHRK
ncbi:uncharacterized protein K452DRAFT_347427 [Aplosporella prunicola CBS 121167]|uniref:Uncharacterized protein n=1 Tax=Aplosporella prunicola CBS 121167 TaxID=1176127 RepID=A0A6A6BJG8_9PEZI|nr:uncharacterized protein K452DRAFT_347427 [Aplosporella prunicola CBS 121167]KAF2143523.1 hypothetical protein K452DRAFT_347427 [Aplosporella prunicola CBS 121167]